MSHLVIVNKCYCTPVYLPATTFPGSLSQVTGTRHVPVTPDNLQPVL
ncbi:hypothetical protein [Alteromonas sp. CYL-A6]